MANLKRLYLLSEAEIDELYSRPIFNQEERRVYFDLNKDELDALEQLSTIKTRLYFILQLGYFKAKHQFFTFNLDEVKDDVAFLLQHFFQETNLKMEGCIARNSISMHKKMILKLFEYTEWSNQQALITERHICELLRFYPKGHDTFGINR